MNSNHDDLLKPTLRPGLDVTRFDRPWDPASLMYVAFFGGFVGGGALFAINAKRMGMREEARRIVVGTVLLTLVSAVAMGWFLAQSDVDRVETRANARLMRFGAIAVALLFAKWMAKRQQSSYDAYDYSDRPKGKLWPYGIAAVVGNMIVHGALIVVALLAFRAARGDAQ